MATSTVLFGIIFALVSAVCFAANRSFASKPLIKSGTTTAVYIGLIVGVLVLLIPLVAFGQVFDLVVLTVIAFAIFAAVGILHLGIGRTLSFTSVKNIGANQASLLISSQILYSIVFAVILLREKINLGTALGAAAIIAGVLLLEFKESALRRGGKMKVGIITGLGAGLIFGFTPLLIKLGLSLYHFYMAGTFLMYVVSLAFYSVMIRPDKALRQAKMLPKYSLVSYVLAGLAGAGAQLFRFGALSFAPIVTVAPLLSAHPIFTFLMTRKLAKEFEVFQLRTIGAIVFIVIGAIVVSYFSGIAA